MTITVGPNETKPTHHLKLSRDGVEVGLILCDLNGKADPRAIVRKPYPRSALKTYSGQQKYEDLEPPFEAIVMADMSGGRGMETFEDDRTRYYDGWRVNTERAGRVLLGGQERYCTGNYSEFIQDMPGSVLWRYIEGTVSFRSVLFTGVTGLLAPPAGIYASGLEIWIRKQGDPVSPLIAAVYSDNAGEPGTLLKSAEIQPADITDVLSVLQLFGWAGGETLGVGTDYHVVLYSASGTADDCWQVGCRSGGGQKSADGTAGTWSSGDAPYYRVLGEHPMYAGHWRPFEYKGAQYMVGIRDGSGGLSRIYINGDRGAADDNAAHPDQLIDATKSWTTNEFVGCIVRLIAGAGCDEEQPWREITANDGTTLTVDPVWKVTHDIYTEYVILGSDNWQYLSSVNGTVKDLAVAGEYVYFAVGEVGASNYISRYESYNVGPPGGGGGGGWNTRTVEEELQGNTLQLIDMPDGTQKLFVGSGPIGEGINVRWGIVPPAWGGLIHGEIGRLVSTTSPWDSMVIDDVTVTSDKSDKGDVLKIVVDAGFTTGLLAVQNVGAVDISHGKKLGMLVKSSVALSAGDLMIVLSGQPIMVDYFVPSMVFHQDGSTQTDMPKAYDANPESTVTAEIVTITIDDFLYIGHTSEIINKIHVDMGSTVNAVASVLTVEYYNGLGWTAVSVLCDGTADTGVTLAKDGVIHFSPPYNMEMVSLNSMACYWLRLKVSVNLTADVEINEIYLERQDNVEIDLPDMLIADTWTWCYLDIDPKTWPPIDLATSPATVASVGLYATTDFGAATILVTDVKIYQGDYPHLALPGNAIINGMEAYNDSATSPQVNPWILTLGGVYEIQMVSGGYALVRLPLREIEELLDVDSGRAHTTNGVYLFFNLGEHLERYYNRQLDDVGPDRDAGLPEERRGPPRALASYPGKVLIAIDAGDDGVSSVLAYKDGAIYEIYRAPRVGDRIKAISHQSIPGSTTGRLWISMGVDMIWVPMSINPEQSEDYRYCHESVLQTGRIYADLQDVEKFWKSVKLVTEDLAAGVTIACDYRTSGSSWTEISDVFDTSPFQEIDVVTDYSVSGRWIELRFRIETSDNQVTPVMMGVVVEGLTRIPVKFAYTLTFRAADRDHDLQGEFDPVTGYAKVDQMDTWVASPLPLLLNSWSNYEDGMYVFPEPSPVRFIKKLKDEDGREVRVCQTTLIGI